MTQQSPLDYRTPPQPTANIPGRSPFALGMALPVALFVGVLSIILILVIPRLENVFKDFGTQLPFPTMLVLNLSRWFRANYLLWGLMACLPVAAGLLAPESKNA